MTTSRTTGKRTKAGASRSPTSRASGSSPSSRTSRKSGSSSSTSRKTTKVAKQAAAKTTSAKTSAKAAASRPGEVTAADTVSMVRELAAVVESHSLSEVIIELPAATLTLRRGVAAGAPAAVSPAVPAFAAAPAAPATAAQEAPAPATAESPEAKPTGHLVTSPFVGTFYRSPNPDAAPYVDVGSRVEKGQPLCIVEAMKLMNEIEADQSGVINAILVDNAEPVEYGQALFEIVPG